MKRTMSLRPWLLRGSLLFGALLLSACAKSPPPTLYLLDVKAPAYLPGLMQGIAIGVGPVEISKYLDRNQVITRSDTPKLGMTGEHQWAEPLKAGVTRVLLVNLGLALDSNRVYELPMRQRRALDYQVPVDVLRFDGVLDREVVLSARWILLSGDGQTVLLSKVSRVNEPTKGPDVEDFVAAQSRALVRLAQEIAEAIRQQGAR